MRSSSLQTKLKSLPTTPGVYLFKDGAGVVIYVGKAKSLKARVGSYFRLKFDSRSKTFLLVASIRDLSFIQATSELEALLLEAELIKRYKPRFNISLKDDKSYLYIVIRNEAVTVSGVSKKVPVVKAARKPDLINNDVVYGPFPNGSTVKQMFRKIRAIFPFRDCSIPKFARYHGLGRPCLYGHIGVCSAPCINFDAKSLGLYKKLIKNVKMLLSGKSHGVMRELTRWMDHYAQAQDFEQAVYYRDLVQKLKYITQAFRTPDAYIDNPYLFEDVSKDAMKALQDALPVVKDLPRRIECYDISNISGKEAVGSMVVATDGAIDKSEYRRFRIRLKSRPDDFGMLREVLFRRLRRDWQAPDLMIIDGGKGQVSSVLKVTVEAGMVIPVVGLAKKRETFVYWDDAENAFVELQLKRDSPGFKLAIQLRDEAHRFAQSYHHLLRVKSLRTKVLN